MSEENFWTIGFRKVRHKRARGIWVYLEGPKGSRPLKTLSDEEMRRILRFPTMKEADLVILESAASIWNEKEQEAFDFAQYTAIQVSVKNVKSNTKG
jgi:hypothetical protein